MERNSDLILPAAVQQRKSTIKPDQNSYRSTWNSSLLANRLTLNKVRIAINKNKIKKKGKKGYFGVEPNGQLGINILAGTY